VFWDSEGVVHDDFLPQGSTINAQCYSNLLCNDVHHVFQKKRPGKLSKKITLLDDSACPHTADFTLSSVGWKIMIHLLMALIYPPVIFVCLDQ
jgi:hypothetical protein